MSDLLWFDGFDDYNTTQVVTNGYYNTQYGTGGRFPSIAASTGRNSSNGMQVIGGGGEWRGYLKTLAPGSTTCYAGFAFKTATLPNAGDFISLCAVEDTAVSQVGIRVNSNGTISAVRAYPFDGTVLGTSTFAIATGVFYFIEVQVTIHPTAGVVNVNVNGASVLALTGQNTRNTTNTSWNDFFIGNRGASNNGGGNIYGLMTFDDLYIHDGTGIYTGFLNDSSVGLILATGQGNYTDGTPSSAVAHYTLINETPANDDTSYVDMSVVGNRESYQYVIPTTGRVLFAAALRPYMKKTDAGPRTVCDFVRASGTNYDGTAVNPSFAAYAEAMFIRAVDPSTGVAWSAGTKELGIKVVT